MAQNLTDYLREEFLRQAWVKDPTIGFIDFDRFKNDPAITAQAAQVIAQHCRHLRADVVVGVARSGLRLARELAKTLDLPYVGSWKDELPTGEREEDYFVAYISHSFTQRQPATIFFPKLEGQQRVIVGEDAVAHGTTGYEVVKAFRREGHTIVVWATEMAKLFQGGVARIQDLEVPTFVVLPVQSIDGNNRIILA